MGEMINSRSLGIGDVFCDPRAADPQLRRVTSIRQINMAQSSFMRVAYLVVADPRRSGQLDMLTSKRVRRMEAVELIDVGRVLEVLADGTALTVHSAEGRLWI